MKAAVLGSPISHSLSPVIHNFAYKQLGLDHSYEAIEVTIESFGDFLNGIDSSWLGFSLTMPLKEIAFDFADVISETAKITGSINTLVIGEKISADNTDVYGISQALRANGVSRPQSATIIGAGATARSAIAALSGLGVEGIVVLARNPVKSAACIDLGNELGITVDATNDPTVNLFATDVVINTTPKGVADVYEPFADSARGALLDVIYDPWPSRLAASWLARKLKVIPGHQMLLYQAIRQIELMTGQSPDFESLNSNFNNELKSRNLI